MRLSARVRNPYVTAFLRLCAARVRSVFLCAVAAPVAIVFGSIEIIRGTASPPVIAAVLLGLLGLVAGVSALRHEAGKVQAEQSKDRPTRA